MMTSESVEQAPMQTFAGAEEWKRWEVNRRPSQSDLMFDDDEVVAVEISFTEMSPTAHPIANATSISRKEVRTGCTIVSYKKEMRPILRRLLRSCLDSYKIVIGSF